MDACIREIINVEELTPRRAAPPDHDLGRAGHFGLVKAAQQSRRYVTVLGMEVIARTVEIGRHRRYEITPMLATISLTKFDAGNFCDGVRFVCRLQKSRQQGVFGNWLGSFPRINAGRAEE